MNRFVFLLFVSMVTATASSCSVSDAGCESNDDCRTGRVCQASQCVVSGTDPLDDDLDDAGTDASGDIAIDGTCSGNAECPDGQACRSSECVPIATNCEGVDVLDFGDGCRYTWECLEGDNFLEVTFQCDFDGKNDCECRVDGVPTNFTGPGGEEICQDVPLIEDLTNFHCDRAIRGSTF